jgi:hypothetical protein
LTGRAKIGISAAMRTKILFLVSYTFFFSTLLFGRGLKSVPLVQDRVESKVLDWNTAESLIRFARSSKVDFIKLVNQFEPQINKFFCGPASSVIVLNTLRIKNDNFKKPQDLRLFNGSRGTLPNKDFIPVFDRYTQDVFFNEKTDLVLTKEQVFGKERLINGKMAQNYGIQIRELGQMLQAYDLKVDIHVVSDQADLNTLKAEVINNLRTPDDFIIVNYARSALGQKGGGHISPLAAYDDVTDSVLILDVNPSHQPWVWVRWDDLAQAMKTFDTVENRGFLSVRD